MYPSTLRSGLPALAGLGLALMALVADSANVFDPSFQPLGYGSAYTLSKPGLAAGNAVAYRPTFDVARWSGDVTSQQVLATGELKTPLNWNAASLLAARDYTTRLIFTRRDDTAAAVSFALRSNFSTAQQALVPSQAVLDYLRGSRTGEGSTYRSRAGIMGDILHSNLSFVDYAPAGVDTNDRLYVGANDGMLHAFNALSGVEEFAYVPATVFANLARLPTLDYNTLHRYYVDGGNAVADVKFASDGATHKVLVSGLGAGGQGYFALDITSGAAANITAASSKLLWEINDKSSGSVAYKELGSSYSLPAIVNVRSSSGPKPVVIVGNGYVSTQADGAVGSGSAQLLVLDVQTGAVLRVIDTASGTTSAPNGLSSPRVIDIDGDGIADYAYAGDLDGNLWRFDLRDNNPANWKVSLGGLPLFKATNSDLEPQPITVQPAIVPHPDGGAMVLFGTGALLEDEDSSDDATQSLYGVRDRFNGKVANQTTEVVQELVNYSYTNPKNTATPAVRVRASSNVIVPTTGDNWVVDLPAGERVLTAPQIRNGRLVVVSTNPLVNGQSNWLIEVNSLTGGSTSDIAFDMNLDGVRNIDDNVDANVSGDRSDITDRVTGIFQGSGLISAVTSGVLTADDGTFFINQQAVSTPYVDPSTDPGVAGGHFDVDTTSYISPVANGSTDGHVHQYDDKFNVLGVNYFGFLSTNLHNINKDIVDVNQKFKLVVVNEKLSKGGRLSINKTYSATDASSYDLVGAYVANTAKNSTIYSLGGVAGSTKLTSLSMYFDKSAIINGELIGTVTGCVRANKLGFKGEWRNGALTIWAVKVKADGSNDYTLTASSEGFINGITSGLLWENTLFWHWKGPCNNEDFSATVTKNGVTSTALEYYRKLSIETSQTSSAASTQKSKPKKGKETVSTTGTTTTAVEPPPGSPYERRIESLGNPGRVSWKDIFE